MNGLDRMDAVELANSAAINDDEVVSQVRAGQAALFEILMRRHNQRVYRVARAILGSDSEAEDVMQETYLRAYVHLDQFQHRAKFSTWLTKIAVHEALARARKAGRLESLDAEPDAEIHRRLEPMSNTRNPEEQLFGQQMKVFLEAALDRLPAAYRSVFVMREMEEMSTAETAQALDVSEEVVKTRLHRARAMLQADLFSQVGATTPAAFAFHLSRCDRVVDATMAKIRLLSASPAPLQ